MWKSVLRRLSQPQTFTHISCTRFRQSHWKMFLEELRKTVSLKKWLSSKRSSTLIKRRHKWTKNPIISSNSLILNPNNTFMQNISVLHQLFRSLSKKNHKQWIRRWSLKYFFCESTRAKRKQHEFRELVYEFLNVLKLFFSLR